MKTLSFCEFVEDTVCQKELALFEKIHAKAGDKCVYLRDDEQSFHYYVVFEGLAGIWKVPAESIMFVAPAKICYTSGNNDYRLDIGNGLFSLNKELSNEEAI